MSIMKIYYKIWVDLLYLKAKNNSFSSGWELYFQIVMMLLMTFNITTIVMSLRFLGYSVIFPKISALPSGKLGDFLFSAIYLFIPLLIFNYFLFFNKERYKKLINKYTDSKGRLFMGYTVFSLVSFLVELILYGLYQ